MERPVGAESDTAVLPFPAHVIDQTSGAQAANELKSCECKSSALLQALPAAVYTTDAEGRITFYNEAAAALWGFRPELGKSEWCGSWRLYWPDGRPMQHSECPMAVALMEKRAIRGAEAIAERPDGTRVPFLAYPTPLFDDSEELIGAVNTLVDITDRKKAEEAALRLAAIVESSDDAIVSKTLNGIIKTWNTGAERLFGYTAEETIGRPITILIPPDHIDEEPAILERMRRGERIDHYETVRRRKDGSVVDVSLSVSPLKDQHGRIIGASKIARDISERKRAQEQQRLLLREMNHRVKNLFTLAGTMVTLSARYAQTSRQLAEAVNERLVALARAHDLTLPEITNAGKSFGRSTTLLDLARTILAPYQTQCDAPVSFNGPGVAIAGNAAIGLALLLHEMATNAAKYGALSIEPGRVDVSWRVMGDALKFEWRERGGPPVNGEPEKEGFGSLLERLTVTGRLHGTISHDWSKEGLTVRLSAPLAQLIE
jgi:PAS domain S-box-containing protein